jgi:hypothetical protein
MVNIEKIKNWYLRKEMELKDIRQSGVLLYFYDVKNFESFYLESLEVVYTHEQTNEIFLLDKPAFYEKGQPVFVVLRGYPISITFEFKTRKIDNSTYEYLLGSLNDEPDKDANDEKISNVKKAFNKKSKAIDSNDEIISLENGCTSFELAAKLDSIYTDKIFSKKKLEKKYYVITMCMFLLGCLITYLLCKIYLPPVIVKEYIYLPI